MPYSKIAFLSTFKYQKADIDFNIKLVTLLSTFKYRNVEIDFNYLCSTDLYCSTLHRVPFVKGI